MGAPPPPSLLRRVRESHLVVVTLLAIWLVTLMQYLLPMILLLPIALVPFIGKTLYRHVTGIYDGIARLATLVPVYSWVGLQVAVHGYPNFVELKARGNAVMLSTHCSRVDWLIGLLLGSVGEHWSRIGFVAEATTALMPVIGWSRLLFGDIFVTRAFHKDGPRIENNIDTFHRSGVDRLIFLAPEGFIADPGTSIGEAYIEDCDVFMNKIGRVRASPPLPHDPPTDAPTDRSFSRSPLSRLVARSRRSRTCLRPGTRACNTSSSTRRKTWARAAWPLSPNTPSSTPTRALCVAAPTRRDGCARRSGPSRTCTPSSRAAYGRFERTLIRPRTHTDTRADAAGAGLWRTLFCAAWRLHLLPQTRVFEAVCAGSHPRRADQ